MKKINLKIILLFSALIFFFSNCTKYSFMSMENKIIGTWTFEKVTLRPGIFKPAMDATKNFKNWEFSFNKDGSAQAYNTQTLEIQTGFWDMDAIEEYDEDGNTYEYKVYFQFTNSKNEKLNYYWDIGSITAKRFRAYEVVGSDNYYYVMLRK
ncbi:MAG TPA: hypothetical protein PKX92_01545 [Edaphocola sp.]|nr:hypothetical protein [Edaphocola sp.]